MAGQNAGTDDGTVWLDDAPVDPSWDGPPDRGGRRLLTVGVPVLALLVLLGSVLALGGFRFRDDTITQIAVGKTFVDGPYEFSFSRATVQEATGYGKYKRIQKVVVTGTVRNLGDAAISPSGDWFLARSHGGQVETGNLAQVGDPELWDGPQEVTPGLPAVRVTVDFEFPPTFDGTTLVFGVGEVTYGTHSYFGGSGNEFWDTGNGRAFRLELPLTRIAAES